jgi:DNA (cytosine-5)-methyltransferase 1
MMTFGSVCSGIEASQLAFSEFGYKQLWSSEIADFPSKVLEHHYPNIPNLGDMIKLPNMILEKKIEAPDLFCGGTPCQAFSLAGWQNGLADERGQLTMTFIDIANAIDKIRLEEEKEESIILWENVEGVLNDRTNAFGNFIAGLAGFDEELKVTSKWGKAGYVEGPTRNVAWRILDAKYFGLPQQRKRLYVMAGGKHFRPDLVLFEFDNKDIKKKIKNIKPNLQDLFSFNEPEIDNDKIFYKDGFKVEIFREYTDCLYAAYGTKWNGNAAAYNGSLYVSQNEKIRRLIPLECERLMGMPDNYTLINGSRDTARFQSIGNSWAVPVINWIGNRIQSYRNNTLENINENWTRHLASVKNNLETYLYLLGDVKLISQGEYLNTSGIPNSPTSSSLLDIIEVTDIPEKFYLSPTACKGILRRKEERSINMNTELERVLYINSIELKITELDFINTDVNSILDDNILNKK